MAKTDLPITFTAGVADNISLPIGTYTLVSSAIPGYTDGTIPEFTVNSDTTEVNLQITAQGTIVVTVTDDVGGVVQSGTIALADQDKEPSYGNDVTIVNGQATFANVPWIQGTGLPVYLFQKTTDANHTVPDTTTLVTMDQVSKTATVTDGRMSKSVRFTIVDANYAGITPLTGTVTVNG